MPLSPRLVTGIPPEPEHDLCCFSAARSLPARRPRHLTGDQSDVPACTRSAGCRPVPAIAARLEPDAIEPCAAAAFLAWIVVRSLQAAPASQRLSVAAIIAVGVVVMLVARFALRSEFFQIPRDSASREP